MKQISKSSLTLKQRTRLFHFTEYEELRMRKVIEASVRYMQKYGQGETPCMVHLENYVQNGYRKTKTE